MSLVLILVGLIGVAVSAIMLIVKVIRKKPVKKTAIVFVACFVAFVVGIGMLPNDTSKSPETETAEKTPSSYTNDEASLTALFEDVFSDMDVSDLSVSKIGEDGGGYVVSYYPTEASWNETSFVRDNISNYINYCKIAYQIANVTDISFEISAKMIDAKGNENVESVQSIWMNKEMFSTFNWDNLEYKNIYSSFKEDCEIFWITPGIAANIETDDIYYVP